MTIPSLPSLSQISPSPHLFLHSTSTFEPAQSLLYLDSISAFVTSSSFPAIASPSSPSIAQVLPSVVRKDVVSESGISATATATPSLNESADASSGETNAAGEFYAQWNKFSLIFRMSPKKCAFVPSHVFFWDTRYLVTSLYHYIFTIKFPNFISFSQNFYFIMCKKRGKKMFH